MQIYSDFFLHISRPLSIVCRKGPKEPLNKKPKLSAEEVRKLVHDDDQKDEKETDTNKKQSIMIDALPQPERKAIHRGISTETIDKITKKPETSVPSTSKLFQRSQSVDSKISKSSSSRIRHTHFAQFSKEDQDIRKKRLAEIEIAKKASKEKEPSVSETVSKTQWARKFLKIQAKKTRGIKYTISRFFLTKIHCLKMTKNQFLNWEKV